MMKKKWLCAALAGVMLLGSANVSFAQGEEKTILFVSNDGNDANSGTIDSPFKTPEAARDKIRELKKEGNLGKDGAVVYLTNKMPELRTRPYATGRTEMKMLSLSAECIWTQTILFQQAMRLRRE